MTSRTTNQIKRNAQGAGIGLPVVIAWALETYTGVTVPMEVAVAIGGVIGSIAGRFGD